EKAKPLQLPGEPRPRRKKYQASSAARGYDAEWRKIRKRHLAANPFCVFKFKGCLGWASEVDHIDGNTKNNKPSNHRSACKPCHSRHSRRQQLACLRAARSTRQQ